jgi:probable F420-dependent oxidoreductase
MQFGVYLPHAGPLCDATDLLNVAQVAEELGFASLWANDHIPHTLAWSEKFHCVGSFDTANKADHLECITTMCFVGAVTKRISLGFSVLVLPFRSPALMAKQLATLDVFSGGRLILGVGAGAVKSEFQSLSIPFDDRAAKSVESIRLLRKYWDEGAIKSEADGEQVLLDMLPRPMQKPTPPFWFGGHTPWALKTTARHCEGWLPFALSPAEYESKLEQLDSVLTDIGKPRPVLASQHLIKIDENAEQAEKRAHSTLSTKFGDIALGKDKSIIGNPDDVIEKLQTYAAMGVEHVLLGFISTTTTQMLEEMELFAKRVLPEFS